MQVKIITTNNDNGYKAIVELEEKINDFIKDRDDITDIKYQGIGVRPAYSSICPSALIIMS